MSTLSVEQTGTAAPAGAQPAIDPLRVATVDTFADFLALGEPWARLVSACEQPSVFLTHDWFACWWESFGQGDRLVVPCVWRGDRLVGAAALRLNRRRFRGLPARRLSFLASGVTGSADLLIDRDEPHARGALVAALCRSPRSWDMMELERLDDQSATWQYLTAAGEGRPYRFVVRPDIQTPIIRIDRTWAEFLAGRSASLRKLIRRRIAGIEKSAEPVRVTRLAGHDEIQAVLPDLFAVSSRSWKAGRGRAMTDNPATMDFYRRLIDRLGRQGNVQVWLLTVGGAPAAFEFHLSHGQTVYPIRADFDERFARLSPGAHLEHEILRHLFEDPGRAVGEYNSCADNYAYERKWTDIVRSHGLIRMFPRNLYGRLLHTLGQLRRRQEAEGREPAGSVRQAT